MSEGISTATRWGRRLGAIVALGATVALGRNRVIAANEKRYADVLRRPADRDPGRTSGSGQNSV